MRSLEFDPAAFEDLAWWIENDRKKALKIAKMIKEVQRDPFHGIGKPEKMIKEKKVGESFTIGIPTDKLKVTFEFPNGYPIKNVSPIVMMKDEVNKAETERIKELLVKEEDPFTNTFKLSIDIPEPRFLYSYFLLYEPPKLREIK